ncbi:glycosyltransferase family 2 protein [Acetobacter estunensis]|uniref:glycosyltransferase family 2 protein n=1 Tax=Acetobacter estunensis TaxID=104097 RepID=UPI001C2D30E4|nr:glycosyltransferase family 2 protein [Acetobacter estunensis]
MKIAIALFVKNEAQDIAGWIAWHLALGADRLFIYDDHSTDGTWEILQAAASLYDIELARTHPEKTPDFYWRQADCYKDACRKATGHYDWIGCLDGDEYVSLERDENLGAFFSKFADYNGVGLSWRIYGSGTRVLKSRRPAYEAYTFHCTPDMGDCELGKAFIRPEDYTYEYETPHRLFLKNERYADALGRPLVWRGSIHDTLWEGACINHYILRSMENYVDRIRRRINSDLSDSTDYWNYFNRNDIYAPERKEFIERAGAIIATIRIACANHYLQRLTHHGFATPTTSNAARLYRIQTHAQIPLVLDHPEGHVTQSSDADTDATQTLTGAVYAEDSQHIYLFVEQYGHISPTPFRLRHDGRFRCSLDYLLVPSSTKNRWHLRREDGGKYIAFPPPEAGNVVDANRDTAAEWEECSLIEKSVETPLLLASPHNVKNRHEFFEFLRQNAGRLTYDDFVLALAALPDGCRNDVSRSSEGRIISWI